jgi:predicted phage terminase large subunit-like protein
MTTISLAERCLVEAVVRNGSPDLLAHRIDPTFEFQPHVSVMADAVRRCVLRPDGRLIIVCPPRHGKSHLVARWTVLWALQVLGTSRVVLASYGADLAKVSGRFGRNAIVEHGPDLGLALAADSSSASEWSTTAGGSLYSCGVGGGLTGRGADLLLVDDLVKDPEDARSWRARQRVWDWWTSVAMTRLQPGASVICIGTRWHEDDNIGRALAADAAGDGDGWEVVHLQAVAEEGHPDPLGRRPGEALCPAWYPLESLDMVRRRDPHVWDALYQGRPSPPEGDAFKRHRWATVNELPADARLIRFVDLAATEGGGDETAMALVGMGADGQVFLVDMVAGRWGPSELEKVLQSTMRADALKWGSRVRFQIEVEGGASGKALVELWIRGLLSGLDVTGSQPTTAKENRILPFAAQQGIGNVAVVTQWSDDAGGPGVGGFVAPAWMDAFVEQAAAWPHGAHDDQLDAAAGAFMALASFRPRVRKHVRITRAKGSLPSSTFG